MKKRIPVILILLALGITGFIYDKTGPAGMPKDKPADQPPQQEQTTASNRWLDKFYIGAVHDGVDVFSLYQNMRTLGFNIWHLYSLGGESIGGKVYPLMQWPDDMNYATDNTNNPVSSYAAYVNNKIGSAVGSNSGIRVVTMRPKIEYLCYGQRSDYQCEPINESNDLWFYSFNYKHPTAEVIDDDPVYGTGIRAVRCRHNTDTAGTVVKRLKANTEQCKRTTGTGNAWQYDSYCDWLIKPRIRIDSTVAHNPANPLVCNVKVIAQDGSTELLNVDIKANYFLVDYGKFYDGRYLEEFSFPISNPNLSIHGDWGDLWGYKARGICNNDDKVENKADIQVYWYGNCDMWIDYVRVDNDVANDLFKGLKDNWLQDEVNLIGLQEHGTGSPVFMKYYMELAEFNNLPCMAYVNSKLKQYSDGQLDLIQDLTNTISVHVPWKDRTSVENPGFLKRQYIDKVGFTQVFSESYPMSGCYQRSAGNNFYSKIPSTLFDNPGSVNNDSILADIVSPSEYEAWFQDNINHSHYVLEGYEEDYSCEPCQGTTLYQDRGNFRYKMQLSNSLSKASDVPFIYLAQAHQWYRPGIQ